ncbi:MAG: UDP-3-O-(3-hydroxymyristoyl)glucosamine N-acyltransferase [Bacteroidetes bacterium]|nr:UDP-3-O-(3-hydroxymyristoyl)glucosamine N-acyltransferase [Bacteroidota bacterium]
MHNPTIEDIVSLIGGIPQGKTDWRVSGVAGIDEATPTQLSFISNPKYIQKLSSTSAGAVIVHKDLQISDYPEGITLIRTSDPYLAFCMVLDKFFNPLQFKSGIEDYSNIHNSAIIHSSCYIGSFSYISEGVYLSEDVQIYPHVFVGNNVKVGKNTVIYPGVSLYSDTEIGDNCIIHSGAVIGSDGFGHAPMPDGSYAKIPQVGKVVIGNNVEIGANCTIDRATLGETRIEDGTKLDNLVHIAHNVRIGKHTVIAGQSGVSGSTSIGNHCMVGGQVGFAGHIQIADKSRFGAQSGVPASIREEGKDWMGTPVVPLKDNLKAMVITRNLPKLEERVRLLEYLIKELTTKK